MLVLLTTIIVLLSVSVATAAQGQRSVAATAASVNTVKKKVRGGNFMMSPHGGQSQLASQARRRRQNRELEDVKGAVVKGEQPPPEEGPVAPTQTPLDESEIDVTPTPTTAPPSLEPTEEQAEEPATEEQPSVSPTVMPTPETVKEGGDVNVAENGKTEEDADPKNATSDTGNVDKVSTGAATSSSMTENPLPTSMILAVVAGVVAISLVVSLIVLRARHRRVEHLVKTGVSTIGSSATAAGEINYNDYDWEELPAPIREAAMTLGYDEQMWNEGHEPHVADKSWERLTPGEQEAAMLLGYSQAKWESE